MIVDNIGEMTTVEDEALLGQTCTQLGITTPEELADMARFYHTGKYRLHLINAAQAQIALALRGLE